MRADEYGYVAKWRNLTAKERRELHGVILFPRDGAAEIWVAEGVRIWVAEGVSL